MQEGTPPPERDLDLDVPNRPRRWERRLAPLGPFEGPNRRKGGGRLVVASNRLPVVLTRGEEGGWETSPATGGLVTALEPVMRTRGGVWVGWSGALDVGQPELTEALEGTGTPYEIHALALSEEERDAFYRGFSNEVLWPLLHGFTDRSRPDPRYWAAYRRVNRKFARTLARLARWDDLIWVHDYHLFLVGEELRRSEVSNRLAFFLHTPFPRPEQLERLPWHRELVEGLLHYDLVGFQAARDRANFLEAVRRFGPDAAENGAEATLLEAPGETRSGAFPISIDFEEFAAEGASEEVAAEAERIRGEVGERTLVLGVDRLDYTKGVPEKLRGLRLALQRYPDLRGRLVLRQLVMPSREKIGAYAETKEAIEELVADINREWENEEEEGWTPVEYTYGTWDRTRLLAHYREADIALVTPLNDGMNLVAKEYCAVNPGAGVLILSAFAGAAADLGYGSLLVNPASPEAIAQALHIACNMPVEERRDRMTGAREAVRANHVHQWVRHFLEEGVRAGP